MDQNFIQNILYQLSIWALPVVLAITVHEAAHGYVASMCGDQTARLQGRVTLNPLPHIDRVGTIILPILCLIAPLPVVFGYAKPVPVNFANLNKPRRDMMLVAAAGPFANLCMLILAALLLHVVAWVPGWSAEWFEANLHRAILINAILAVFNMMPIPPLDGGRIMVGLLPYPLAARLARLEPYGIFIVIGVLFILPAVGQLAGVHLGITEAVLVAPMRALIDVILLLVGVG